MTMPSGVTGGSQIDAVDEAHRICNMLLQYEEMMTPKENSFVGEMLGCKFCSPKQLFWLRDIKTKYAE